MGLLIEGVGDGWVVLRRVGAEAEICTFGSLDEMRSLVTRELLKAEARESVSAYTEPTKRVPVVLPKATLTLSANGNGRTPAETLPDDVDCRTCGACCAPAGHTKMHVALESGDAAKLPHVLRQSLLVHDRGGIFMRTKTNAQGVTVCAALSGVVGKDCKCGIYSKRPMTCFVFEKGGEECLAARSTHQVLQHQR